MWYWRLIGGKVMVFIIAMSVMNAADAAAIWSASGDFSTTENPNGSWSYGWKPTLAGATFTLGVPVINGEGLPGLIGWGGRIAPDGNPSTLGNITNTPIVFASSTVAPGELIVHPGPNGEYDVVRWTAPSAGLYDIFARFGFYFLTTTDVHVLLNGFDLFSGLVEASSMAQFFRTDLFLQTGDVVDFAVGIGSNGTFFSDTTRFDAVIREVPEPGTLMLLAASLAGLLLLRWHNRGDQGSRSGNRPCLLGH